MLAVCLYWILDFGNLISFSSESSTHISSEPSLHRTLLLVHNHTYEVVLPLSVVAA